MINFVKTLVVLLALGAAVSSQQQRPAAIEPHVYQRIHRLACMSKANRTLQNIVEQEDHRSELERHRDESGCSRELHAWRWRYFDEESAEQPEILLREHSIDKRLANVINTIGSTKIFDIDSFRFNSGDALEDAENARRMAGQQVDEAQCGEQLRAMLDLMADLERNARAAAKNESLVLEEKHIRMAKVLDSFGRYESNHLTGRLISIGSYEQCQNSRLPLQGEDGKQLSKMRFCWARHSLEALLDESLGKRQRNNFEMGSTVLLSGVCLPEACHSSAYAKHAPLFDKILSSQFRLPSSIYTNETLPVESVFCLADESSQVVKVPLVGRLFLAGLLCYLLVMVYATWRRGARWSREAPLPLTGVATSKGRRPESNGALREGSLEASDANEHAASYWDALDLVESWHDFTEEQRGAAKQKRPVDLDTLNPIKVVGCAYVVFGHSVVIWSGLMMNEIYALQSYERDAVLLSTLAGTTVVDTFFVISGLLTGFLALSKLQKISLEGRRRRLQRRRSPGGWCEQGRSEQFARGHGEQCESAASWSWRHSSALSFGQVWLFLSLSRYLRLVPLFFIIYWLKRLVLVHAGAGPMWDWGVNRETPVGACLREPWYVPLTPASAYYSLTKQCLLPSWSLSNEMIFGFVTPPIIFLFNKRPGWASFVAATMSLASIVAGQLALARVRPELHYELFEVRGYSFTRIVNEYSYLYTSPQYRIFSTLIGLLGGYKLFRYSRSCSQAAESAAKQERTVTITQQPAPPIIGAIWRVPATALSCLALIGMFALLVWSQDIKSFFNPYHTIFIPLWLSPSRAIWAVANVVLFMRMMTDWKDTALMRFFASKFWRVYSKLIFAILLIHFDLLAFVHLSSSRTVNSSLPGAFIEASGVYLLCLPLSVFLFVVFENPLSKLFDLILFKRTK